MGRGSHDDWLVNLKGVFSILNLYSVLKKNANFFFSFSMYLDDPSLDQTWGQF